jgi:hypothetical protein
LLDSKDSAIFCQKHCLLATKGLAEDVHSICFNVLTAMIVPEKTRISSALKMFLEASQFASQTAVTATPFAAIESGRCR